jgi:hypothetical protein
MNIVERGENRRGPTGREKPHWSLSFAPSGAIFASSLREE